jgi:glycosyltransferase involved in cell wall biosynthesis
MNILQMISKNDRYGAQRIFLDQVAALQALGNQVMVAGRGSEGYVTDSVRALGVPYYGSSMKGFKDLLFLRRLIKEHDIDVIHTTLDRADYLGVVLAKITGRPVVSTNMVPRYHVGFRFADKVIVLAEKQRPLLEKGGVNSQKITLVRPGIDVERFSSPDQGRVSAWKQKLNTDAYNIVLCHISSIIERKAHLVSIDIAAGCKQRGERPLLIIIGDPLNGEYYESLVTKIASLGLTDNVRFTGWTAEVPEILSLSHFTVLPSENEALGVVLMEGMAAGTPIIAREGEGGAELIDAYGTGFLYRPMEGVDHLVDQIVALRRDEKQYQAMSRQCRKIALDDFSMKRFGEKLMEVYEAVLAKDKKK